MSSSESKSLFDSAADFIRVRLAGAKGVDQVLDRLKERADTDDYDPLSNRSLILESPKLAQQIAVPRRTVEAVIDELHLLNLVHIWARATCPTVDTDEGNVLVETDDAQELRAVVRESCAHCGQYHDDLGWMNIETFYAINLRQEPGRFRISRLFQKQSSAEVSGAPESTESKSMNERLIDFFRFRAGKPEEDKPVEIVASRLDHNEPASQLPSSCDLTLIGLRFIAAWALLTISLFVGCRIFADWITTAVVLVVMLLTGIGGAYWVLRAIYAASATNRSILYSAYMIGGILWTVSLVEWSIGYEEGKPFSLSIGSGRLEPIPVIAGAVVVVAGHICVAAINMPSRR
jgi:hypothetical protein